MLHWLYLILVSIFGCITPPKNIDSFQYQKKIIQKEIIHEVMLDRKNYTMQIIRAQNGKETVSSIAARTNADIAINGGFFHNDGSVYGVLKVKNEVVSCGSKQRGALLFNTETTIADRIWCNDSSKVQSQFGTDPKLFQNILGGTPLLIFKGLPIADMADEKTTTKFIEEKFARTAIGIKGSTIRLVLVEGSSTKDKEGDIKDGFTIPELVSYFHKTKSDFAVNLDGGGSSTLVIHNKVINHLRKEERPVSEALVFIRKDKI